ncbi:MAG: glycosyltransferase family 4 protein [Pyrinomonadaceae bacterium]
MRIALCKSSVLGPISGADEIMLNYAVHLHQAGHDVSVILLYPPTVDDQYLQRLKAKGVIVKIIIPRSYLLMCLRALRNLTYGIVILLYLVGRAPTRLRSAWLTAVRVITQFHYRACRTFLRTQKLDVMHVFTPDPGAAVLIRAGHELGVPVLYHEMGTADHMPILTEHYSHLEKVLPLCAEVAALSPRLAAEWSLRFPFLDSVSVLPLIAESTTSVEAAAERNNGSKVVFGFAARLEEGKGPLILLDAMDQLKRKGVVAVTRIAGKGPQSWDIRSRARALGLGDACVLIGSYSDLAGKTTFMKSLDVFVLPSLAEGTPNGVIEAMAHGLPVIATWVGGIPDIVNTECGLLIPPGDADALAEAMQLLAGDPVRRAAMGAAAKKRCEQLFSPQSVLPVMLQTYARVTRNGHEFAHLLSENGIQHPWIEPEVGATFRA